MGNSTSSRAKAASNAPGAATGPKVTKKQQLFGARGRKVPASTPQKDLSSSPPKEQPRSLEEEPVLVSRAVPDSDDVQEYDDISTDTESEYDTESDDEEEDEEFDEYLSERLRILSDARTLKNLATAFLHPELPVVTSDPTATARCYFDRPSAPAQISYDEAEERAAILADAAALKAGAVRYAHPELPVVTSDPTACARCYFDRASAPERLSHEEAEERAEIMADVTKLKKAAFDYLHPEVGVTTTDPTATARCYFDRPSAPEQESVEEMKEREAVLAEAAALKKLAVDYAHPELPVVTSDPTAMARCYFDRPSAPEQESVEEMKEREAVLADAARLKKLAVDYAHPELPVVTSDPTATARCYFDRASAPEQESVEEAEERAMALADAAALKKLAVDYAHPELPVVTSDPTATARCYFDRASAPEQESLEEMEEREAILAEAAALKKLAIDYAHPELPVVTSDPTATARCYFDRASAPEQESVEMMEEREAILAEAAALKKLAIDYAHPELPVVTSDPTATARCYFDRASAPEQESLEEMEEREAILAEAAALKKLAIDYAHPELPVVTSDPTATARCYFDRASAPCDLEQIISTSAYAVEKKEDTLEDHMERLAALAPASKVKTIPAAGPAADIPRSASEVHLFDLQDAA